MLLGATGLLLSYALGELDRSPARSVSDFVVHPVRDSLIRVDGMLVKGSLCKLTSRCEYRFQMTDFASQAASDAAPRAVRPELSVRFPSCVVPDTFRDLPGVDLAMIVEGELCASCQVFEASQVLAKSPHVGYRRADGGAHDWSMLGVPSCANAKP